MRTPLLYRSSPPPHKLAHHFWDSLGILITSNGGTIHRVLAMLTIIPVLYRNTFIWPLLQVRPYWNTPGTFHRNFCAWHFCTVLGQTDYTPGIFHRNLIPGIFHRFGLYWLIIPGIFHRNLYTPGLFHSFGPNWLYSWNIPQESYTWHFSQVWVVLINYSWDFSQEIIYTWQFYSFGPNWLYSWSIPQESYTWHFTQVWVVLINYSWDFSQEFIYTWPFSQFWAKLIILLEYSTGILYLAFFTGLGCID